MRNRHADKSRVNETEWDRRERDSSRAQVEKRKREKEKTFAERK